jgi:hypothetical protein
METVRHRISRVAQALHESSRQDQLREHDKSKLMNSPVYPKKHLLTLGALLLLLVQLGCHKEEHHEHERVELVVTSPLKQDTELQRE